MRIWNQFGFNVWSLVVVADGRPYFLLSKGRFSHAACLNHLLTITIALHCIPLSLSAEMYSLLLRHVQACASIKLAMTKSKQNIEQSQRFRFNESTTKFWKRLKIWIRSCWSFKTLEQVFKPSVFITSSQIMLLDHLILLVERKNIRTIKFKVCHANTWGARFKQLKTLK